MKEELIAPCGMNCALCISYQFMEKDYNKQGFHRKYCPGCIPRGMHCLHMAESCALMKKGIVRFCYECDRFPCERLRSLDKRYRSRYHMSMIDNLREIQDQGIVVFLAKQEDAWKCSRCDGSICCHTGLCLSCDMEELHKNKKYRWDEEEKAKRK